MVRVAVIVAVAAEILPLPATVVTVALNASVSCAA